MDFFLSVFSHLHLLLHLLHHSSVWWRCMLDGYMLFPKLICAHRAHNINVFLVHYIIYCIVVAEIRTKRKRMNDDDEAI